MHRRFSHRFIPTLAMIVLAGIATSLGFWQLDRAAEKKALQVELDRVVNQAPTRLTAQAIDAAALDGMPVAAAGVWDDAHTVFLDNRTHDGIAGFHVFTPLRIAPNGTASAFLVDQGAPAAANAADAAYVIVLRGFVARDILDRSALPTLPVADGIVEVVGQAKANLPQSMLLGEDVQPGSGEHLWQRFSIERFAQWSELQVQGVVIRQANDTADGLIRDWPQPGLKIDMHYGYAFQWFGIALSAIAFWAWAMFFRRQR